MKGIQLSPFPPLSSATVHPQRVSSGRIAQENNLGTKLQNLAETLSEVFSFTEASVDIVSSTYASGR